MRVDDTMDTCKISDSLSSKILHLIIFPTEKCNFRCTYCYESFEHGAMGRETVDAIKALINERSSGLSNLTISWFGGEPLLNSKLVVEIGDFCKKIMSSTPGFSYGSDATTNGYLLDIELAKSLIQAGVDKFQISLDGDRLTHNRTRLQANGTGSFDAIWKNLMNLRASSLKFKILLRVHYTLDNIEKQFEFAKTLKDTFSKDLRFEFFFKNIVKMGGKNDQLIVDITNQQRESAENKLYSIIGKSKTTSFGTNPPDGYICYASKANSFVIRADGRIQKCTVALEGDHNNVGKLMPDGSVSISQDKYRAWIGGLLNGDESQLACPNSKIITNNQQLIKFIP